MLERLGEMAFGVNPHMLRHAYGFKLANQGVEHTVGYTELSPDRFRNFWKD